MLYISFTLQLLYACCMKRRVIVSLYLQKPVGGIAVLPPGGLSKKKKDKQNENEKENHNDLNNSNLINDNALLDNNDEKSPSKKDLKKKDKETPEKKDKEKKEKIKVSLLLADNSSVSYYTSCNQCQYLGFEKKNQYYNDNKS